MSDVVDDKEGCDRKVGCPLFPILKSSETLDYWKSAYCDGNFGRCVRYQKACAGKVVPAHLLPNGKLLNLA